MSAIITPIHIAVINGQALRFFRICFNDGRPDLPWHANDDLQHCLGFNRAERQSFLHKLRSGECRGMLHTIATAEGLITIAPHVMAQFTIETMIGDGMAKASVGKEYDEAFATPRAAMTDEIDERRILLMYMLAETDEGKNMRDDMIKT